MLVVPSVAHEHYARALAPLLDGSQPIFINPGHTGGGLHFLHELRKAGYRGPVQDLRDRDADLHHPHGRSGDSSTSTATPSGCGFAALPGKHTAELFALLKPLYPEIEQADERDRDRAVEPERGVPSRKA